MSTATRRGFIAGALAGAAVPSVARAASAAPAGPLQAKQQTVRRGRAIAVSPSGRRVVVAHDQRRTIALVVPGRARSRLVDVGGQPLQVAISPDGRLAAVTTAFWDEPGLTIVDLHAAALRTRVAVGPAPYAVEFTADGRRLIVTGGEQEGTVHVLETRNFKVVAQAAIGTVPRGIAPDPRRDAAWIALSGLDRVVRVDLASGRVRRKLSVPWLPDDLAISPDGRRLLVSHGGTDAEYVSEIDVASGRLARHRAGRLPSAVAWTRRGRRLATVGGTGEVVVLGARGRTRRHRVGGAPRGLAVAGNRAWTVDALTGAVRKVRV
jgi:DNA-binding beta-propeller fold protein YncE